MDPAVTLGLSAFARVGLAAVALAVFAQPAQAAVAPPTLDYGNPANATRTVAYSLQPTTSGDGVAYTLTAGALPDGLSLDADTGEIAGTPTGSGSADLTVRATNPGGYVEDTITLRVLDKRAWAGDGSDLTDLGGGQDITAAGVWSGGELQLVGATMHGAWARQTPAGGKFSFIVEIDHTLATSTNWLGNLALLSNQAARRLGSYAGSGGNPGAGDQSVCIKIDSQKFEGAVIVLQRQEAGVYTDITSYVGDANPGTLTRTIQVDVDASGASPTVTIWHNGVKVIDAADVGAGANAYGRNVLLYTDGSGGGTTPLAGNAVAAFQFTENA